MSYLIKTVSSMTGIPKNTLIAWERRHGVVEPSRTASGYRRYSDEDVRTLLRIKELIAAGYRISEAADMVRRQPLPPIESLAVRGDEGSLETLRDALTECLIGFDRAGAEGVAEQLATLSFETRLSAIYLPLMQTIGDRWENGEVSVAQEHFASAWVREQMVAMMRAVGPGQVHAREVVCATPSGDRHEMGILGAAVSLALRGWKVTYLGVDVPSDEVAAVVSARHPALVALSMVLVRPPELAVTWLDALRERVGDAVPFLVGGRAVTHLDRSCFPANTHVVTKLEPEPGGELDGILAAL